MPSPLTRQEVLCLRHAADGLSDKEIAIELGLAARTVSNHLRNAYRKLGVTNRTAAVGAMSRIAHGQESSIDGDRVSLLDQAAKADVSAAAPRTGRSSSLKPLPPLPESRLARVALIVVFMALGLILTAGVIAIASVNLTVAERTAPANAR